MKVLVLSPYPERIEPTFGRTGDTAVGYDGRLDEQIISKTNADMIVAYGHRYIIDEKIIARCRNGIVNLHISYLPWNRGANPNFWSFYDDTPAGVSIIRIDSNIDTGYILARQKVDISESDTLASSYDKLRSAIEMLLDFIWDDLREGGIVARPQPRGGSFHWRRDAADLLETLPFGWDTPVEWVREAGRAARARLGR